MIIHFYSISYEKSSYLRRQADRALYARPWSLKVLGVTRQGWTAKPEYNFSMPLSASIENLPKGIAVVTLSGGLTLGTSLKIADSQIQAAIEDGVTKMVIDLTDVEYVDSAGLGMLMYVYGMLNDKKGVLRLCGVTPRVMSLLQMTKADTFLPIDQSRDESLAAIRG